MFLDGGNRVDSSLISTFVQFFLKYRTTEVPNFEKFEEKTPAIPKRFDIQW